ncbi:MAG TPA: hypothetical protein VNO14_09790 [Blastocatellia bacterium]|nr:hypothetical protein [Blastocatellia bacterium]
MKLSSRTAEPADIAKEILAYLASHPDAQDTMEGIVEWWLLEQEIRRSTALVNAALAELVSQGLVLERLGRDGRTHYRINRKKAARIRALLGKKKG